MFSRYQVIKGAFERNIDDKKDNDMTECELTQIFGEQNKQEVGWHYFASPSSNALLDDDPDEIYSYFIHRDQLKDVVACPGVILPSLQNSCYVPIEDILDLDEDDEEISLNNQNHTTQEQSGPVKKLTLSKKK